MSKASDFAHAFASNLPIEGVEWNIEGKTCTLEIHNEDISITLQVKLNITKSQNRAEIWESGHFLARCSADTQCDLSNKLNQLIVDKVKSISEYWTLSNVNKELCDYLVSELEQNGFKIINKSVNPKFGKYLIKGASKWSYQIEASYENSVVNFYSVDNNKDSLVKIKTFNLSNPEIEKTICSEIVDHDSKFIRRTDGIFD